MILRSFNPATVWALILLCSCSQDSKPIALDAGWDTADAIVAPDLHAPDRGSPPQVLGAPCIPGNANQCGSGLVCLELPSGIGVCSVKGCRKENPLTPAQEDDCPFGSACGEISVLGSNSRETYCFRTCTPSATGNECAAIHPGLSCDPRSALITGNKEVCAFPACQKASDCDPANPIPRSRCDERTQICFSLGKKDARIGDPCLTSFDCGSDQYCFPESKKNDQTLIKDGYCTKVGCIHGGTWSCPSGSICYQLGSSEAVSLCLAAGCNPNAPAEKDGCRDQTVGGDYDCLRVGSDTVCWQP
jgi:hypothetical protein